MTLTTQLIHRVVILTLHGRFDANIAPEVTQWLDRQVAIGAQIVVNLSDVHFIDSAALSALLRGVKRSRLNGSDLKLCALQQPVQIIFELSKMDRAFEVYSDIEAAICAFEG